MRKLIVLLAIAGAAVAVAWALLRPTRYPSLGAAFFAAGVTPYAKVSPGDRVTKRLVREVGGETRWSVIGVAAFSSEVKRVEGDDVTIERRERKTWSDPTSEKETRSLAKLRTLPSVLQEATVEDEDVTIEGRVFHCKKIAAPLGKGSITSWCSPDVPLDGRVRSVSIVRDEKDVSYRETVDTVGFARAGGEVWGKSDDAVSVDIARSK